MITDPEFEYGAKWGQTVEKNFVQLGGFVNNSYLEVNNKPLTHFGVTAGMGHYRMILFTLFCRWWWLAEQQMQT